MNAWRLIESPPSDISSQMALDRELFEEWVEDPALPPLLRIYRVSEPGITVGRSYKDRSLSCAPICIRPTGGGLVEHGSDLLYSVMARKDSFPTFKLVRTSYLSFHEAIQDALQRLGVETRLFRCDEAKKQAQDKFSRRHSEIEPCFQNLVATDLLFQGKKIAGGAQWRRGPAFLHQGSILPPFPIPFFELKSEFLEAFTKKFQIEWEARAPECC